jgi:hypothetical protein
MAPLVRKSGGDISWQEYLGTSHDTMSKIGLTQNYHIRAILLQITYAGSPEAAGQSATEAGVQSITNDNEIDGDEEEPTASGKTGWLSVGNHIVRPPSLLDISCEFSYKKTDAERMTFR